MHESQTQCMRAQRYSCMQGMCSKNPCLLAAWDKHIMSVCVCVCVYVCKTTKHKKNKKKTALQARDKYLPLRTAWLKNSKAVAAAEFEDEQATEHAGTFCAYLVVVLCLFSGSFVLVFGVGALHAFRGRMLQRARARACTHARTHAQCRMGEAGLQPKI